MPVTVAKRRADGVTVLAMRGPRSSYEIGVHLRLMVARHGLPVLFDLMLLFNWVAHGPIAAVVRAVTQFGSLASSPDSLVGGLA